MLPLTTIWLSTALLLFVLACKPQILSVIFPLACLTGPLNGKKNSPLKCCKRLRIGRGNSRHGQLSQRHITMSLNGEHVWWHQACPHIDCSTGYNTNSSGEPLNFKANSPSSCPGRINTSQSSHAACLVMPLSVWTNGLNTSYWETEKSVPLPDSSKKNSKNNLL